MPDRFGFDHLPHWGQVTVRCIEPDCDAGGQMSEWPEAKRERHARWHVRERQRDAARRRNGNLREARRLQKQLERENALAYREEQA